MPRALTVVYSAFRMAMLHWMADPQWIIPNIIAPFVFTTVALTLFKESTGPFGLYAVLGGGMMGMWATQYTLRAMQLNLKSGREPSKKSSPPRQTSCM